MTVREIWEGMLTELSKTGAPSLLVSDFNYFLNKSIKLYINKRYNIYDINLQTTDDLSALKTNVVIDAFKVTDNYEDALYKVELPSNYLHLLNCICIYKLLKNHKCHKEGEYVKYSAKRATSDAFPVIINNYYTRPLPERPYYCIYKTNNTKEVEEVIEQPIKNTSSRTFSLNNLRSTLQTLKSSKLGSGNDFNVRLEINYGDDKIYKLEKVKVDYIRTPLNVNLTLGLINLIEDTSLVMEFPDYVCQEIINELTMLVMENNSDPRLLTNIAVTKSIAPPAQQLTQTNSK